MRLFIAEKPSLGKAIAQCLPGTSRVHKGSKGHTHISFDGGDAVTWCFGHIYELFEPDEYNDDFKVWKMSDLPIVPKEWKLKPKNDAKEQIKVIKDLISKASEVINAGDPDREGQLLVDEVLEELGCTKPVKRLWLNATDEQSVRKALSDIRDNADYQNLSDSAKARSWGDWLVGMNATRKMTLLAKEAGIEGVFSVGRVQTPSLSLIVQRDLSIENFKAKDFYTVRAEVHCERGQFFARWIPGPDVALDESGRLLDQKLAVLVAEKISGKEAKVIKFDAKEKSEPSPLTYSLDKLQMDCNKILGLSAQDTLSIAQELYEEKMTSYPRTDCGYLPESQHSDAADILQALSELYPNEVEGADPSLRSQSWNDKKVTAHHGIIPTGIVSELTGRKKDVYDLIVRRYICQFYAPYKYQQTEVELISEGEKLSAKGRVPISEGWRSLLKAEPKEKTSTSEDEGDKAGLPDMREGESSVVKVALCEEKKTTPPPRFTEASLLQAMLNIHQFETDAEIKKRLKESAGIGTPATRANIIETLKKRGFIEEKKKSLLSTAKGRQLIEVLPLHIKSPGLTALFEQLLESVSTGEITKDVFLEKQTAFVAKFIQSDLNGKLKATGPIHLCPQCKKGNLRKRAGSKGVFWGCSAYPDCSASFEDVKGRPSLKAKPKAVISETEKCKDCGSGLVKRSGKKGFFWGCSGYPNCKTLYQDFKGKPKYE